MNPTIETILNRRSIRNYKSDPIPQELLKQVLEAAVYAPSARNRQPWQFVVVEDRAQLEAITQVHPYTTMLHQAPCAVVVCGDLTVSPQFWTADCAAATQNILLAARALGLGSCWCGVEGTAVSPKLAQLLELPQEVHPYSLIVLGYPAEEKARPQRELEERIHRNRW